MIPERGKWYRAGDLPAGSLVRMHRRGHLYRRCERISSVMVWGQPIPGSADWQVEYLGPAEEVER